MLDIKDIKVGGSFIKVIDDNFETCVRVLSPIESDEMVDGKVLYIALGERDIKLTSPNTKVYN